MTCSTGIFFEDVVFSLTGVFFTGLLISVLFNSRTFLQKLALHISIVCVFCSIYFNEIAQQSFFAIVMEFFWCLFVVLASQTVARVSFLFASFLVKFPKFYMNLVKFWNKVVVDVSEAINADINVAPTVRFSELGFYFMNKNESQVLFTNGIDHETYDLLIGSLNVDKTSNLPGYLKFIKGQKAIVGQPDNTILILETSGGFLHVSNEEEGQSIKLFDEQARKFLTFLIDLKPCQDVGQVDIF